MQAPILRRSEPAMPCLGSTCDPSEPPATVKITATTATALMVLRTCGNLGKSLNVCWPLLKSIT